MGNFTGICQISRRTIHEDDPCVLIMVRYEQIYPTPELDAWMAEHPSYERFSFGRGILEPGVTSHIMIHKGAWDVFREQDWPPIIKPRLIDTWHDHEDSMSRAGRYATLIQSVPGKFCDKLLSDLVGQDEPPSNPQEHPISVFTYLEAFIGQEIKVDPFCPPCHLGTQGSNHELLASIHARIPINTSDH